jgi:tetratricopeptide (TPR) repeat protein
MGSSVTISNMIKAAELYRKQGLLEETIKQYQHIEKLIRKKNKVKNKESLLKTISDEIESVNREIAMHVKDKVPKVSSKARGIMQTMFSIDDPEVKGSVLFGEAITLTKFGQYEAAMEAFEKLFAYSHLRVDAAKKMLEQSLEHMGKAETIKLVHDWESDQRFSREDRNHLIKHLQDLLKGFQEEKQDTC